MKEKIKNISAKEEVVCYNVPIKEVVFLEVLVKMKLYKEDVLVFEKENLEGTLEDHHLIFQCDNATHTLTFSKEESTFTRETDEFLFKLVIKEEPICTYLLKETDTLLSIHVEKTSMEIQENACDFEYCIETDDECNGVVIEWMEKGAEV